MIDGASCPAGAALEELRFLGPTTSLATGPGRGLVHDYAVRRRRTARAAAIARHTAPVAPISGSWLAVFGRVFFSPVPVAPAPVACLRRAACPTPDGAPPAGRAVDAAGADLRRRSRTRSTRVNGRLNLLFGHDLRRLLGHDRRRQPIPDAQLGDVNRLTITNDRDVSLLDVTLREVPIAVLAADQDRTTRRLNDFRRYALRSPSPA